MTNGSAGCITRRTSGRKNTASKITLTAMSIPTTPSPRAMPRRILASPGLWPRRTGNRRGTASVSENDAPQRWARDGPAALLAKLRAQVGHDVFVRLFDRLLYRFGLQALDEGAVGG